eukprot:525183-Pyramimonas_sp.AAC.1
MSASSPIRFTAREAGGGAYLVQAEVDNPEGADDVNEGHHHVLGHEVEVDDLRDVDDTPPPNKAKCQPQANRNATSP